MINTRNKFLLIILTILITLGFGQGQLPKEAKHSVPEVEAVEAKQLDPRAQILSEYFKKYNSPFENQAQNFVDAADKYGIDWKLVPAIAGVESTFGKHSYGYNAWGWGIYGDQALGFNSWKTGIDTVTGGLKTGYIDKGLTDPYSMNRVYAASPTWGSRVAYFIEDIQAFARGYTEQQISTKKVTTEAKTAGASARLAFK